MLNLNQLECFVAVAEELHFGRAAERLCMTQPPLSRQIQLLEHAVAVQLFDRSKHSVRLTPAGQVFLTDAKRLLNLARQATTSAQRASKGETGRVTIGFTSTIGFDLIPDLIVATQRALPDIDVVLHEMITSAQLEALECNTIDLGFIRPLVGRQALNEQLVAREPLIVVLPASHPLASHTRIKLNELNGLPFIMYSPAQGKYFYNLLNGLFASTGVRPNYIQHLDLVHSIVNLVRSGVGVSIVPASAEQLRFDSVAYRPLWQDDVFAESQMAWRSDHNNPALSTFLHFATSYFAQKAVK